VFDVPVEHRVQNVQRLSEDDFTGYVRASTASSEGPAKHERWNLRDIVLVSS
jgi:hypothetical protein